MSMSRPARPSISTEYESVVEILLTPTLGRRQQLSGDARWCHLDKEIRSLEGCLEGRCTFPSFGPDPRRRQHVTSRIQPATHPFGDPDGRKVIDAGQGGIDVDEQLLQIAFMEASKEIGHGVRVNRRPKRPALFRRQLPGALPSRYRPVGEGTAGADPTRPGGWAAQGPCRERRASPEPPGPQ